jgi:hypothetical protein
MTFWEEAGWIAMCTVGMFVVTLLMAWKAEGYIRLSRSTDSAYRLYGFVGKLFLVVAALLIPLGFIRHADIGEQLMYWIAVLFLGMIGGWIFFFRWHRFPQRRWENNVMQPPPDDPTRPIQ